MRMFRIALFFSCMAYTFAIENLALNKPAWQAHNWSGKETEWGAWKAVDGQYSNRAAGGNQCTISADGQQIAEWRVDLGRIVSISYIDICYRTDNVRSPGAFYDRFAGFYLYVSNTTSKENGKRCFHELQNVNGTPSEDQRINCSVYGRFVIYFNQRIQGFHYPSYYSQYAYNELCEVKVFGCPVTGYYGENCTKTCPRNCQGQQCDANTGNCLNGCIEGFKGPHCSYFNLALRKPAWQENDYPHHSLVWGAAKAVDGKYTDRSALGYQCTISADGKRTATWRVDLQGLFSISHIHIYYRTGNSPSPGAFYQRFAGFFVYISNDTSKDNGVLCFHEKQNISGSPIENQTLSCPFDGRYVIYYNERRAGVHYPEYYSTFASNDLCEFEVYGCPNSTHYGKYCDQMCSDSCLGQRCNFLTGNCLMGCSRGHKGPQCRQKCDGGMFGGSCSQKCGHCYGKTQCHHINGSCLGGCSAGYIGSLCNKQCVVGTYGLKCNKTCGLCSDGSKCHHVNGSCVNGCSSGYKIPLCITECDHGFFGDACREACGHCFSNAPCHHISGSCLHGCSAGYQGPLCKKKCDGGKYGLKCNKTCGPCSDGSQCHHVNGSCLNGCSPGYKSPLCIIECDNGFFGDACRQTCGQCLGNPPCHHINGSCPQGCSAGYQGPLCKKKCYNGTFGPRCKSHCGNCTDMEDCDHVTGYCKGGCKDGSKGNKCDTECDGGLNCSKTCGHCRDDSQCNHINGTCFTGCSPGYKGSFCISECNGGMYGVNCSQTCGNCLNDSQCHHVNGTCLQGCSTGYKGLLCTQRTEPLRRQRKPEAVPSIFPWTKSPSINFDERSKRVVARRAKMEKDSSSQTAKLPIMCIENFMYDDEGIMFYTGLSSYTDFLHVLKFPSTRVLLDGTEIPVKKPKPPIALQATFSTYKNRNTVKVLVGSSPGGLISYVSPAYGGSASDRQLVERSPLLSADLFEPGDSLMADKGFNVQDLFAPKDSLWLRLIQIDNDMRENLTQKCDDGRYGFNCAKSCGYCRDDSQCNHINGTCFKGCSNGYKGSLCISECSGGMYGVNCSQTCGNCLNDTQCHHVNGTCLQGCSTGYKGLLCDKQCDGGMYGVNCSKSCGHCLNGAQCHHINGTCVDGCSTGYKGYLCLQKCEEVKYGLNCSNSCGNCHDDTPCHHVNGTCLQGCSSGYHGMLCTQICPRSYWGVNCNQTCNTDCVSQTCNHESGVCLTSFQMRPDTHAIDRTTIIICVVVSIFIVFIGSVLNFLIWRRNRSEYILYL
ncbi:multiple epidermal growth factor-like domains protein 10 [Saccostrea cucullata]|uniref:multiple epidermal growth factor-like domains protein 10 n=1 Tax=Saccostrea cuccullata TaxID=36930 RepID=UPI002ED41700